jgi:hypothetical protein
LPSATSAPESEGTKQSKALRNALITLTTLLATAIAAELARRLSLPLP